MRFPRFCLVLVAAGATFSFIASASAALLIEIDKSSQKMTVSEDGEQLHVWPVSTGGAGYDTPSGDWKPFRMEKDHFSREWDDAPMPHSIFFTQEGHAIHGTFDTKNLGKPASHGCVRLSRAHAAALWTLVRKHKMANTKVVLTGEIPGGAGAAVARKASPRRDVDYERFYATDAEYDDYASAQRRQGPPRGWREYNDGQRYYYSREPYYAPPPRVYRAPPAYPFGW